MEEKKEKEESLTKQLYHFAGSYKYLSILSTILAAISAFVALVPFYYIKMESGTMDSSQRIIQ